MEAIAIQNLKGGVGKTVTAVNMAAILAMDYGFRVLLVDCDSQCNASDFFGAVTDQDAAPTLAGLLVGTAGGYISDVAQSTDIDGLDILAASDALMDLDVGKIGTTVHGTALRDLCGAIREDESYDYVIFDLPPAFNAAAAAALLAADSVIVPIKLDAFSLSGLANLMRQISSMRQINPKLRLAGCLVTMWQRTRQLVEAHGQLLEARLPVFETKIRRSPKVDEMTFERQPITVFSPRSGAGRDYRDFVDEFLAGGAEA